ncbi:efflux transporter periplasmic adaptor subunit [Pseudomonas syringae pv. pisi]
MNQPNPDPVRSGPATGAAMDAPITARRLPWRGFAAAVLAGVAIAGYFAWPRGLEVARADVHIATAELGAFRDELVVRAQAVSLTSVMLDSTESGRVEEVIARDGLVVTKGELLFRLSNPQRHLDLLARQSEHAQQISNLASMRVALETSRADHQRRISELSYETAQAGKHHQRAAELAAKGFLSPAQAEEASDRLAQQRHLLAEANSAARTDLAIKQDVVRQMQKAIAGLETGLALVGNTVNALAVRAPVAGRLTDFRLQVGETVRPDQRIGRIDDPARFKLTAQVDEFYLTRVAIGHRGSVEVDGRSYLVEVSRIFPQIKDGRFVVELVFARAQPGSLRPGQSADTRITLGAASKGLLLPNSAFVNDSGGAYAYVVAGDGRSAVRRPIRVGRRSNSQIELLDGIAAGERVIVSSVAAFGKAERLRLVD